MHDRIEQAIKKVLHIPNDFHLIRTKSLNTLLQESGYFEFYESITESEILRVLEKNPNLVFEWLQWSGDQRSAPAWIFTKREDGYYHVGHYPKSKEFAEMKIKNEYKACAYFIKCNIERSRNYLEK